jgi:hypothetical protein
MNTGVFLGLDIGKSAHYALTVETVVEVCSTRVVRSGDLRVRRIDLGRIPFDPRGARPLRPGRPPSQKPDGDDRDPATGVLVPVVCQSGVDVRLAITHLSD